jgi:diguanylate cyclase (GGDEF)-like protein
MGTVAQLNPAAFPDSPYAIELQRGAANRRFCPRLEAEYCRTRLMEGRALVRVTCLLAVLVAVLRGAEQLFLGSWNTLLVIDFGLVIAGSVVLAAIAWSSAFERLYLPWARLVVPCRNTLIAVHIAEAAARGQLEVLMGLPVMLVGSFFFFGLRFPTALVAGVLIFTGFLGAGVFFELTPAVAIHTGVFLALAVVACAMAARHFERCSRTGFLEDRLIADLAQHDTLTGTKNRRVFDEHLTRLWQQAVEDGRTVAILLLDVDHFKAYNDRYGHLAGDLTLRRVAQTAQSFVRRPLDILARYGGEEFAAILYDVEADRAKDVADRICRAVAELAIEHSDSRTTRAVTISVGVAVVKATAQRNPRGALQLADQALYEAKVRGRNRVELLDDEEHRTLVTGVFANPSRVSRG